MACFYVTIKVLSVNTKVERGSGRSVFLFCFPLEKSIYTLFRFKEKLPE